jgi:hypothetical protein
LILSAAKVLLAYRSERIIISSSPETNCRDVKSDYYQECRNVRRPHPAGGLNSELVSQAEPRSVRLHMCTKYHVIDML